jgi:hypothetical protein
MSETGAHAVPEYLALEAGEDGLQRDHCATRRL